MSFRVFNAAREIFRFKKQSTPRPKAEEGRTKGGGGWRRGRHCVRDAISLRVSSDDFSFALSLRGRPSLFDRNKTRDMTDRIGEEKKRKRQKE